MGSRRIMDAREEEKEDVIQDVQGVLFPLPVYVCSLLNDFFQPKSTAFVPCLIAWNVSSATETVESGLYEPIQVMTPTQSLIRFKHICWV